MGKKLTTEEWITKAKQIHGNKYDYSKVNYVNARTKIKIICPEHGEFLQLANGHLQGYGCKECGLASKTKTLQKFIKEANIAHSNKYKYTKTNYINAISKVIITCPIHGEFLQTPHHHIEGGGCPDCAVKARTSSTETFIKHAINIHGIDSYNYSLVKYTLAHVPVEIVCKVHGKFKQSPNSHLNGRGCPKCGELQRAETKRRTTEQFVEEAKRVHGNTFDYSITKYTNIDDILTIICKEHGDFKQIAYNHLKGSICPYCAEIQKQIKLLDKPSRVYYIKIQQPHMTIPIYKIGISAEENLHIRFSSILAKSDYEIIWLSKFMSRKEAVEKEQSIVVANKQYKYLGSLVKQQDGNTYKSKEFFIKDIRR